MKRQHKKWLLIITFFIIAGALTGSYYYFYGQDQGKQVTYWGFTIQQNYLTDKTLASILKGDSIYPKLSPDGNILAFAEVIVEKGKDGYNHEFSQVKLYDIQSKQESILLDAENSKQYAFYSASVVKLRWINDELLEVSISDGDIGISVLQYNIVTKQLFKKETEAGNTIDYELSPEKQAVFDKAATLFPNFDKIILKNALQNSSFYIPGWGLIFQKRTNGTDKNIWLMDFKKKTLHQLLALPSEKFRLEDGLVFQNSILFLVADNSWARFYRYRHQKISPIAALKINQRDVFLDIKARKAKQVLFLVKLFDSYEKGANLLYAFDGKHLSQYIDYPETFDVDINLKARRAAFCYWENGERHLVVREFRK